MTQLGLEPIQIDRRGQVFLFLQHMGEYFESKRSQFVTQDTSVAPDKLFGQKILACTKWLLDISVLPSTKLIIQLAIQQLAILIRGSVDCWIQKMRAESYRCPPIESILMGEDSFWDYIHVLVQLENAAHN